MSAFDIAALELQKEELDERLQRLRLDFERTQDAIKRAEIERYRLEGRIAVLIEQGATLSPKKHKKRTNGPILGARAENPNRATVTDSALALIAERGRPLSRSELFDELAFRGLRVEGKDPLMLFSTMLWRERHRIKRLRGFGYWPADRPYPPANYNPGIAQPSLL